MGKQYTIKLEATEWGQLLDGIEARAESWEKTSTYLRMGDVPGDEPFIIEECSDADESDAIARLYREIIMKVRGQIDEHHE